jgi:hypothetical protein
VSSSNKDNFNYFKDKDNIVFLELSEALKNERIVTAFIAKTTNSKKQVGGFIELKLNRKYEMMTVVSDIYNDNWIKTIDRFSKRAKEKGVEDKHIIMLTDTLDNNAGKIIDIFGTWRNNAASYDELVQSSAKDAVINVAIDFVEKKTVRLFLDQVKTAYIAVRIGNHTETMPIESAIFENWLGAAFYNHQKNLEKERMKKREEGEGTEEGDEDDEEPGGIGTFSLVKVLANDEIKKVQKVFKFEANNAAKVETLHVRVAALINTADNLDENNAIYYDLCNPDWDIIRITRNGWSVEKTIQSFYSKDTLLIISKFFQIRTTQKVKTTETNLNSL